MRIKKIALWDFRCFSHIEVDFDSSMTVLVASNGQGKTSVLDAVAVAYGPFIGAFDEGVGTHFLPTDIRQLRVRETISNEMEYAKSGVRLEAVGTFSTNGCAQVETWSRSLSGPTKAKTTIKDSKYLIKAGKELQEKVRTPGTTSTLPLVAYYGTGRLWQQKKFMQGKLPRTSRTIGYTDCLDPGSSYKSFVAWFKYWTTNVLKAQVEANRQSRKYEATEFDHYLASISGAVNSCLAISGWKDVSYSLALESLVAHHDEYGELPVDLLSDGIRNMIGMVADIAFRATKLNPHFAERAAKETPGIVLIDEVDMHLHPQWQQIVLEVLQNSFPKIQFIVTTHSPQVLSTVANTKIRVLERHDGMTIVKMPEFSPLAHESGDALTKIMDTNREPELPIQEAIRDYEQLVRAGKEHTEEAQALRSSMDTAGYQLHESDLNMWRFLAKRSTSKN